MKKKIMYIMTFLVCFCFIQNIKAAEPRSCSDTNQVIATFDSSDTPKISDVNKAGTKCMITIKAGSKNIGSYSDNVGANGDCGTDEYNIKKDSGNTYKIVKRECKTNYVNSNYDTKVVSCGTVRGIPRGLTVMSRNAINAIKLIVPIILIIMGIIDMFKAAAANDEKVMKDSQTKFIKRIIAAVLVFFVVAIIQFVLRLLSNAAGETGNSQTTNSISDITDCISCFIATDSACSSDDYFNEDTN